MRALRDALDAYRARYGRSAERIDLAPDLYAEFEAWAKGLCVYPNEGPALPRPTYCGVLVVKNEHLPPGHVWPYQPMVLPSIVLPIEEPWE